MVARDRTTKSGDVEHCATCGMALALGYGEYHPFTFCEWYRQGLDPWKLLAQKPYTIKGAHA